MATNLLLEGDDLEALLIKAHSEGGPNARIVRADKYRHGGLWGFFARERFEVAVEIPEPPGADPRPEPMAAPGADRALEPPVPAALATQGLLDIADRVSAAEAVAQAVRARYEDAPATARIDLPAREALAEPRADELVAAGRIAASAGFQATPSTAQLSTQLSVAATTTPPEPGAGEPSTSRPEFTALLDTLRDEARPAGRTTCPPGQPASDLPPAPERTQPLRIPGQRGAADIEKDDAADRSASDEARSRAATDRATLRALGVPPTWAQRLRPGDRFAEVLRVLATMPQPDIDPATPVVAVVGPADSVRLEAHRTALDLAVGTEPRPVIVLSPTADAGRAAAAQARRLGPVVLAVETDGEDAAPLLDALLEAGTRAVIAVVDAGTPLEDTRRWLDTLGKVDALVLDGAVSVPDPAAVLNLRLPVVRLDGIPVDPVTWTALLCAQLVAAEQAVGLQPDQQM